MASDADFAIPGPLITFPAPGLRDIQRNVTTHNEAGEGVFLPPDNGTHQSVMVNGGALSNILYQTTGWPVDLNGEKDVKWSEETAVSTSSFFSPPPIPFFARIKLPDYSSVTLEIFCTPFQCR